MLLKDFIIYETIKENLTNILIEDKITPFVKHTLNRFKDCKRGSRIQAANFYKNRNPRDKALYKDDMKPCSPNTFFTLAVKTFLELNGESIMSLNDFKTILNAYLSNYNTAGILI